MFPLVLTYDYVPIIEVASTIDKDERLLVPWFYCCNQELCSHFFRSLKVSMCYDLLIFIVTKSTSLLMTCSLLCRMFSKFVVYVRICFQNLFYCLFFSFPQSNWTIIAFGL